MRQRDMTFERPDGSAVTVLVDYSDYPDILFNGAQDADGNDVELAADETYDLYERASVELAGSLADEAMDRLGD